MASWRDKMCPQADFDDLLGAVSSVHAEALSHAEKEKEVLRAQISKLQAALQVAGQRLEDVECVSRLSPQLHPEPHHRMGQDKERGRPAALEDGYLDRDSQSVSEGDLTTKASFHISAMPTDMSSRLPVVNDYSGSGGVSNYQSHASQRSILKGSQGRRRSGAGLDPNLRGSASSIFGMTGLPTELSGVRDADQVKLGGEKLLHAVKGDFRRMGTHSMTAGTVRASMRGFCMGYTMRQGFKALRKVVQSFAFDLFCAMVIMVNAVSVGIEVHILAAGDDVPVSIHIIDVVTVAWYTLELVLRLWADKIFHNIFWNFFDFVMLVVCIMDLTVEVDQMPRNYSIVRFLRFVRVLRVLKMLKIGKTVNNYFLVFSKMTYCLLQSLPSLLSAATVIMVFTYISAVLLTQAATDHRESYEEAEDLLDRRGLKEHYGSLDRSFYTLGKAIFNGQSWGELMQPLTHVSSISTGIFVVYLMLTLLCFLNVINGVFVDSTLQSTAHYKELMVAEAQQKRIMLLQHLQDVFHEIDTDDSGYITVQEFDACLHTEGGRAFFEVMGLSTVQAYDLFRLIDADASDTVDIEEFCTGCMRFMGEAKNFDIQCIIAENQRVLLKWTAFIDNFEACIRSNVAQVAAVSLGAVASSPPAQRSRKAPTPSSHNSQNGLSANGSTTFPGPGSPAHRACSPSQHGSNEAACRVSVGWKTQSLDSSDSMQSTPLEVKTSYPTAADLMGPPRQRQTL